MRKLHDAEQGQGQGVTQTSFAPPLQYRSEERSAATLSAASRFRSPESGSPSTPTLTMRGVLGKASHARHTP